VSNVVRKLVLLAAFGALGTLARAGLTELVRGPLGAPAAWATVTVNLLGCFLFGFVWALTQAESPHVQELRLFALVGFMGAFTTFSSYVFDLWKLASAGRPELAFANLLLQNAVGFAALFAGLRAAVALGLGRAP
jgi:CrcB protein